MDKDLSILYELDAEHLGIFVDTMIKKGELTEMLTVSKEYKNYGKHYGMYLSTIEKEFLDFGSNTFWSNKTYKEIVCDVAKKLKVNFNKDQKVSMIEEKILEKVLVDTWERMSNLEKQELANMAKEKYGHVDLKAEGAAALVAAFRAGGFYSYQLTLIIINTISKMVLGRGLSLAANASIAKALGILSGPIGIVLTALWTIIDLAGPAYRVTIPGVILIAGFRKEHELRKYVGYNL